MNEEMDGGARERNEGTHRIEGDERERKRKEKPKNERGADPKEGQDGTLHTDAITCRQVRSLAGKLTSF